MNKVVVFPAFLSDNDELTQEKVQEMYNICWPARWNDGPKRVMAKVCQVLEAVALDKGWTLEVPVLK